MKINFLRMKKNFPLHEINFHAEKKVETFLYINKVLIE